MRDEVADDLDGHRQRRTENVMFRGTYLVGSDPVRQCFLDAIPGNLAHHQVGESRLERHEQVEDGDL